MTSTTHSPLLAAATSTFESLALLLPDAEPSADQLAAGPLAWGVALAFDGPLGDAPGGTLIVRTTDDVARAVAANMLGLDAADDPRLVQDALGELANVICGNVLPELAGREAVFHLAAPRPLGDADAPTLVAPTIDALTLGVDDGRVEVALRTTPPLPAGSSPPPVP